ncbi:MAG TPA: helix-turn-helix transcriptional regulator [Candidatus Acidoferrum sp.]|jgi:transcriptional regulator with XRE-family HTH domain|nr:helix-turn-helix transcriptional regulator [Candidatus Acidoferrum sp.]
MAATNKLFAAPPYPVEKALKTLGTNLRTARLRRKMTIEDVAQRIGTGPRAVMDAEKGKPSSGIAVYTALLWAYGLLGPLEELADPTKDKEGLARESATGRIRARKSGALDNDF